MQNFTRPLLVLLAVLPLAVADHASAQHTVATDKAALEALYDATDGTNWTTNTKWKSTEPLSAWSGVTTNSDGRVTRLALNNNGLDGTLPAALGDLSELEQLDLQNNALRGALPSEFANLTNLTSLLLTRSRALTGPLPDGLRELADLTTVYIGDTELCAPDNAAFQTWWSTISKTGLICPPTEQSVIDVAVFYTPAARDDEGGTTEIEDEIDSMVAGTNTAYRDSGVNQRINLVAVAEVAYTEVDGRPDLIRLRFRSDGHMDEVHAIRDRVGADIVMLILRSSIGWASLMTTVGREFASSAFGVSGTSTGTFAHELGHIMGLHHDRYEACNNGSCPATAFPYAYGYVNQRAFDQDAPESARWSTIMAYPTQCSAEGYSCSGVPRFSDPEQIYPDPGGDPLGIAGLTPSGKVDGPSDAARALNRTRAYVAKFRQAPDITVSFGAGSYTATEGGTGATVTVQLSVAPTRPIVIPLMATPTTAALTYDYTSVPASVRFGTNDTAHTFTVTAVDDTADEDGESLTLSFGEPLPRNVTAGSQAQTVVTLADNDTVPGALSILSVELTSDPGSDGFYVLGDAIEVSVRFNKTVTVTGTPQLELRVGSDAPRATYRDSAGEVMRFVYTVADGDSATNGVSIDADSVLLNGGTIRDSNNPEVLQEDLTHSAVAADANQRVDAVGLVLQSAKVNLTELRLTFDKVLDETAVPATSAFTVRVDGAARSVTAVAMRGSAVTLTLSQEVAYGEDGATVSYTPGTPLLQDVLGNPAAAVSNQTVTSEVPPYDIDTDGLIEISDVMQLNAMRYDLDGDGDPSASGATTYQAAFPDDGTPLRCANVCTGYELSANLDFDAARQWNSGNGWEATGAFDTTFEGNGHTIANLYVNRPYTSGTRALFGRTTSSAVLRNVGLVDVNVRSSNVASGGALVGSNYGMITASYATGQVRGGYVGGLVASNYGTITGSYAAVRVIGQNRNVGGLVGTNTGTITASYATGWTSGDASTDNVGGLVGTNIGTITASYATGPVSGGTAPGGLVGTNTGTITTSSWDTTTSGRTNSAGGTGRTTSALQATTGSTTTWDHGTASQYSALRGKGDWTKFGYQLRAGPTLTATGSATRVVLTWEPVVVSHWPEGQRPDVTYTVYRNTGTTVSTVAENESGPQYTTTGATDTYQVAAVVNGGEVVRSGWAAVASASNQPPTVQKLTVSTEAIPESGVGNHVTVTVTLSHPSSVETVVLLRVMAGAEAVTPNEYELTIPPRATSGEVTLTALDKPGDGPYQSVTVRGWVIDLPGVQSPAEVRLTIIDDDPPEVSGLNVVRYTERETQPVATYTATNPANIQLAWAVSGPDGAHFSIDRNGVLGFDPPPDFERPRDVGEGNVYTVTIEAADTTSLPGETLAGRVPVTVTVEDALGRVNLPSSPPQIGAQFTARLADPDGVGVVTAWCWERSLYRDFPPADPSTLQIDCAPTTTATYTPVDADRGHYLRATATYTDSDGTMNKTAVGVSDGLVTDRQTDSFRPPGNTGGGGGGGGGPACAQDDVHGNTATQATAIELSTPTTGAICPAGDVDYFTVTAPGRGLVFIDTTRGVPTRGIIWQNDVVLASGSTGGQQNDRLGALVQAGPVVVAVQGQGGATGSYAVEITFVRGYLENPGADSFQSGVGVLSGWVCEAEVVEIELNGVPQEAAYGTERLDTAGVCGDTDNGFGLLFNWNLLRDGEHEVVALVDGVELGRATVAVTTLGQEFLRGVTGTCEAEDFPILGARVTLEWQQTSQNFVIAGGSAPSGTVPGRTSTLRGFLENPGPNSFQSGVGVLSGWVCDAEEVEIEIGDTGRQVAAYGTERADTAGVCGDTDNGFGLLFNWNLLGEGEHEVVAYVDGIELGRATVRVTTLGHEFLRGAEGECMVEDFARLGQNVLLEWQQNSQNFVITDVE